MQPTKQEYFEHLEANFQKGLAVMKAKNADYAGDTNPFRNFESSLLVGVSPEKALGVRIMDKISRMGRLFDHTAQVKDEQMEDTLLDLMNYANILNTYLYFQKWHRNNFPTMK